MTKNLRDTINRANGAVVLLLLAIFLLLALNGGEDLARHSHAAPFVGGALDPPIGTVVAFAGPVSNIPDNWLVCDGRVLSRADSKYRLLFAAIGTSWGGRDNTFNLPDMRGLFLRGVDKGADGSPTAPARDPARDDRTTSGGEGGSVGNNVGSLQGDSMQSHKHADQGHVHPNEVTVQHEPVARHHGEEVASGVGARVNGNEGSLGFITLNVAVKNLTAAANLSDPVQSTAGVPQTGAETRPKNANVYWIIKYR
jgi:hypothetical protein